MHGTGNDFILVEKVKLPADIDLSGFAKLVCNRKFGIGSDGLLVLSEHEEADFEMVFHNPDGSLAEMCGNGIRCLGKYIHDRNLSDKDKLRIQTGAGVIPIKLNLDDQNHVSSVAVAMGYPDFRRTSIPVTGDAEFAFAEALKLESGLQIEFHGVSMGNPHAVIFVDDIWLYPVREIGSQVENNEIFPKRINVEFVKHISKDEIAVRIWERGAGETLSCGTGVCAASAVCYKLGITGSVMKVTVLGGTLVVNFDEEGAVYLTGPAVEVFTGRLL